MSDHDDTTSDEDVDGPLNNKDVNGSEPVHLRDNSITRLTQNAEIPAVIVGNI